MKRVDGRVLVLLAFIMAGCARDEPPLSISNQIVFVDIDGYTQSCTSGPSISVRDGLGWSQFMTELPPKGNYFLDGEFYGYGMCDVVVCNKIDAPYQVELNGYEEVGSLSSPIDSDIEVPSYRTVELTGKLRVEFDYFADKLCPDRTSLTIVVEN